MKCGLQGDAVLWWSPGLSEPPARIVSGTGESAIIGLPSLRTLDGLQTTRIWLAVEATDMRCGFDRLAERVSAVISQDPLSGHLFVFASRRHERLKILTWDRDGYVLWYKRLEAGVFKLPRVEHGCVRWSFVPANWP